MVQSITTRPTVVAQSLPLLKVRAGMETYCMMTGTTPITMATHWLSSRTVACLGDESCPGCAFTPKRSLSYMLLYQEHEGGIRRVVCETSNVALDDLMLFVGSDNRGQRLRITRSAAKRPLCFEVLPDRQSLLCVGSDDRDLLRAISVIYSLPAPVHGESYQDWWSNTYEARLHRIKCLLPS